MSQEKKPDPIEDVREGLGLLFRAAKNAVRELPTEKIEESLKTGVREVSRAVENVAGAIEREVFGAKKDGPPPHGEPNGPVTAPDGTPGVRVESDRDQQDKTDKADDKADKDGKADNKADNNADKADDETG